MSLWKDSNAPTELTEAEIIEINSLPEILQQQASIQYLRSPIISTFNSVQNAKRQESNVVQELKQRRNQLEILLRTTKREQPRTKRELFFQNIHRQELLQQQSLTENIEQKPSSQINEDSIVAPQPLKHARSYVVNAFQESIRTASTEEYVSHRKDLLAALIKLYTYLAKPFLERQKWRYCNRKMLPVTYC